MRKNVISIIISFILILISFFYTNEIIYYFKNKDPIMIKIKEYDKYSNSANKVDIESSYRIMKKTGKYDNSLLVFKESISSNIFSNENYITSLGEKDNNISIVFELNNTDYINQILNILESKNVNATFFVSKDIFDNYIDIVKKILNKNNDVELLSNSYSIYEVNKYNSMLRLISNDKLNFCINLNKNEKLLDSCRSSKLYSVSPIIVNNNIYHKIKNTLDNGSIILLKNNNEIVKELLPSLNYIKQKGKNIILLKNIIK